MGLSTFIVGLLPNYATIGIAAPIILIALRLLQGLALGGEYGGAATYVAEHAPMGKRGYYTSWIQTTATLGLFLSLLVILFTRTARRAGIRRLGLAHSVPGLGRAARRLGLDPAALNESPVFQKMKDEGKTSKAPLTEAFGQLEQRQDRDPGAARRRDRARRVVWYTGQFYALFFLQSILKVDGYTANLLIAWSLLLGTPFFIVFGALSDKIGRKPIIMAGCLIAALTYFPIFKAITTNANPALEKAIETVKVEVVADPAGCGDLFNPVGTRVFTAPCDTARAYLAQQSVKYDDRYGAAGSGVKVVVNGKDVPYTARGVEPAGAGGGAGRGYPKAGDGYREDGDPFDIFRPQVAAVIGLLFILVIYVTMVYGPIAAMLVELFPTRIRYTSMSLPYHIGNGWFGGLLPATAFAIVASTGDIYAGPLVSDHLRGDRSPRSSASSSCRKPRTSTSRRRDSTAVARPRPVSHTQPSAPPPESLSEEAGGVVVPPATEPFSVTARVKATEPCLSERVSVRVSAAVLVGA
jgi:MFS family permease